MVAACATVALCTGLGLAGLRRARLAALPKARVASTFTTEALLANTQVPAADPYDLASRLRQTQAPSPANASGEAWRTETPSAAREYSLGDRERFWAMNLDPIEVFQVQARLRYVSPHLYMWVQDGVEVAQEDLEQSAQTFEERLYPTVRKHFGSEWTPGIDNQTRLTVLNLRFTGALGYFTSRDEFPPEVITHSNQREMFYINPEHAPAASTSYITTLAHEFQHMVHWLADPNEDAWVNEGSSELAIHLCGYSRDARINAFARSPDTQLTNWEPHGVTEHYGASFLFLAYFAERFGPAMTRELVASERNGIAGFEAVLQANQTNVSFQELFSDWVVANRLDGEKTTVSARYAYDSLDVQAKIERTVSAYPAHGDGTVHQYAADYVGLQPTGQPLILEFGGPATTRLVPNQPHSGTHYWWSNRGDNSDMTLTRAFDLGSVEEATLEAWLWYDIEEGWDHAYVEASTDRGKTWTILAGQHTSTFNPSGNSYGPGYTGSSSAGTLGSEGWMRDSFDLSPFAGERALIRFEYLTDEAVHQAGLCVDDIAIPELGYAHDAESEDDGWVADGFIRSDNTVPQQYILQLIRVGSPGRGGITVERLVLNDALDPLAPGAVQTGTWLIDPLDPSTEKAILVISATAPSTTEVAPYHYELRPTR